MDKYIADILEFGRKIEEEKNSRRQTIAKKVPNPPKETKIQNNPSVDILEYGRKIEKETKEKTSRKQPIAKKVPNIPVETKIPKTSKMQNTTKNSGENNTRKQTTTKRKK